MPLSFALLFYFLFFIFLRGIESLCERAELLEDLFEYTKKNIKIFARSEES